MFRYEQKYRHATTSANRLIVSFDLEWAKNYKVRRGNKPFCFSFVYFSVPTKPPVIDVGMEFGFVSAYIEAVEEIPSLISDADSELKRLMSLGDVVLGHQLSSDISVLINYDAPVVPSAFQSLKEMWHQRRLSNNEATAVFDTRYDMEGFLQQKSRRLVDVCTECNLLVVQPELKVSMTRMQNSFLVTHDKAIMERLAVLNIRHSLSAALLYVLHQRGAKARKPINVNRILVNNLSPHFSYVNEHGFRQLSGALEERPTKISTRT